MFKIKKPTMRKMEQFLRIANARLRKVYPNRTQRRAWAAKMYVRWLKRQDSRSANPHNDEP